MRQSARALDRFASAPSPCAPLMASAPGQSNTVRPPAENTQGTGRRIALAIRPESTVRDFRGSTTRDSKYRAGRDPPDPALPIHGDKGFRPRISAPGARVRRRGLNSRRVSRGEPHHRGVLWCSSRARPKPSDNAAAGSDGGAVPWWYNW